MKYVWIVMLIIADAIWLWFAVMDIRATVHRLVGFFGWNSRRGDKILLRG